MVVQVLDSGELPARSFMDMDTRTSVTALGLPSLDAIGVGKALASPPSEPHGRFSRIRLSSWQLPLRDGL